MRGKVNDYNRDYSHIIYLRITGETDAEDVNPKDIKIEISNPDVCQLEYDDRFDRVLYPTETMMTECVTATIADIDKYKVPIMTSISLNETGINSYIDSNGIYIQNEVTGLRSKSYKKESSIPKEVIQYIRKGEI